MTTPSEPPFPNIERLLVADFKVLGAGRWYAGGVTPADLQETLPFAAVRRAGGPSDNVNDYPFVEVEVHAGTLAAANDVAEEIRQRLLSTFIRNEHGQMDRAVAVSGHTELPPRDPALRRIVSTYRATCRRTRAGG